jgi:hypothetical protein
MLVLLCVKIPSQREPETPKAANSQSHHVGHALNLSVDVVETIKRLSSCVQAHLWRAEPQLKRVPRSEGKHSLPCSD